MPTPLSSYVLTHNSERYLGQVLEGLQAVSDEILVIDSGSTDGTAKIAEKYGATWIHRPFDNFMEQRNFAQDRCTHDWVFALDSDEVMDEGLITQILTLKEADFVLNGERSDCYRPKRRWYLFGQEVRAFLPVSSPDYPIRLFDRHKVRYHLQGKRVHETPSGHKSQARLDEGALHHYSCDSLHHLYGKLNQYTTLAAEDLHERGRRANFGTVYGHSIGAFIRWYFRKGGWRDGRVGFLLGLYAFSYTFQKYLKLMFRQK